MESWLHGIVFVLQHAGDNRTVSEAYKRHSKQATANGTKHAGYLYMPTPLKLFKNENECSMQQCSMQLSSIQSLKSESKFGGQKKKKKKKSHHMLVDTNAFEMKWPQSIDNRKFISL